jgi:quercetin 2,3-dioxygenase
MSSHYRNIEAVIPPPLYHMVGDGFRVHNFFPSDPRIGIKGMDPFFLMDYGSKWIVPPSAVPKGVGVHPHRGFETVTIAYHGSVAHHDSAGNKGVIAEGDVQWMTAAKGILHKEYHEKEFSKKGGLFQMVQLWVNLPARYKMTAPKYQAIEKNNITKYLLKDGRSRVELIAGEYNGLKGRASTFTPINLFNAILYAGAEAEFSFPEKYNTGLLIIEGEINVNKSQPVTENNFVLFGHKGLDFLIEASKDSTILILSGEPIDEPLASGGPFLMNTESEIKQAYNDYYNGDFGYLED